MSHITGTIQTLGAPVGIGPNTGAPPTSANTWAHDFAHSAAPGGTKLLVLHFQNVSLPPGHRLEVDLGYDTDVFTSASGASFWTRPINIYVLASGLVPIRYISNGSGTGGVELDRYGRGERHAGESGHPSFSNSDPFLDGSAYLEPIYDPFWYCVDPPNWENAACAPPGIQSQTARSVGMILSVHGEFLSTCSVTLVDVDKVITAGHCHTPTDALTGSVIFHYRTECDGTRPPGYVGRFYKVVESLKHRFADGHDYSLLRLAAAPADVPVTQLRHDIPPVGEQVFGVHHPNGAVQKLSLPHGSMATVIGSAPMAVQVSGSFHVSGGSSGSGLFDAAGRIIGVLSNGAQCGTLAYYPMSAFLADTIPAPPPPITRDVMIVLDRSGSMSEDDGTGRTKIEVARDAVSLFVQLVLAGTGNRIGLVTFATAATSPLDFALTALTNAGKTSLVGPAPYSGGIVGAIAPGGATSIGSGLAAAAAQLATAGPNPRSILLLTDGLHNTPPPISAAETGLTDITLHAIGLGSESSLDGDTLSALAHSHDGLYMRAGNGLALEKFFTQAFGNIFEAGLLFDPEFDLPANASGTLISFPVCGEEAITAVAGWDRTDSTLLLELTSPTGAIVTSSAASVHSASGRSWTFLRVELPHAGERNGVWKVRVVRPAGGGEFPPPTPALRYFLNVVPRGGPRLLRQGKQPLRYYTGDEVHPLVALREQDGGWPHDAEVELSVTRPHQGAGNLLTTAGLGPAATLDGDVIPARYATLRALELAAGHRLVNYSESTHALRSDSVGTRGGFESAGMFGLPMPNLLTVEGTYTFRAKASYGEECRGGREVAWSISVAVGIDPGATGVTIGPSQPGPNGTECFDLTFTPRDRFGNQLGPGRADSFTLEPQPGTQVASNVQDLGNGSYRVRICWDPAAGPPAVGIGQPERPVVVINVPGVRMYSYSVPFVCGEQKNDCCQCAPVTAGVYATQISIHNPTSRKVALVKRVLPVVLAGAIRAREPKATGALAEDRIVLPEHSATMDDCCRLAELLLGAVPSGTLPLTLGVLEVLSPVELAVSAIYTTSDATKGGLSLDTLQVLPVPLHAPGAASKQEAPRPDATPPHARPEEVPRRDTAASPGWQPQDHTPSDRRTPRADAARSLRLVFEFDGPEVKLVSSQRLAMVPPPPQRLVAREGEVGSWFELRDHEDRPLYRRSFESPYSRDEEVVMADSTSGVRRVRSAAARGTFFLIVPDLREARKVSLSAPRPAAERSARGTTASTRQSHELSFDLPMGQHD